MYLLTRVIFELTTGIWIGITIIALLYAVKVEFENLKKLREEKKKMKASVANILSA